MIAPNDDYTGEMLDLMGCVDFSWKCKCLNFENHMCSHTPNNDGTITVNWFCSSCGEDYTETK